jgi:hypothetical protein
MKLAGFFVILQSLSEEAFFGDSGAVAQPSKGQRLMGLQ